MTQSQTLSGPATGPTGGTTCTSVGDPVVVPHIPAFVVNSINNDVTSGRLRMFTAMSDRDPVAGDARSPAVCKCMQRPLELQDLISRISSIGSIAREGRPHRWSLQMRQVAVTTMRPVRHQLHTSKGTASAETRTPW